MQSEPSSQADPSASTSYWQPATASQISVVQGFPSSQLSASPVHTPTWQVSETVQASPSLQTVPAATRLYWQPLTGSQVPLVHGLSSSQETAAPPHTPPWQVSGEVQALSSSQALPLALTGSLHSPVRGSQAPASWHWSLAAHTTGSAPAHWPPTQVSNWVHRSPSSHPVPLGSESKTQPCCGSQVSTVHSLPSSHTGAGPPVQAPAWQKSAVVQASLSSQPVPLGAAGSEHWPVAGSQVPTTWHGSLAAHTTGWAPLQTPA